jgi:hypothetical protein
MVFTVLWLCILVVGVIAAIANEVENKKKRDKTASELDASGYTSDIKYLSYDGTSGIAVDESRKTVCIISSARKHEVNYSDVISSEIIEDGETITKTSRTSQVGGLSGKKTSKEKVKHIYLQIIVNDISSPAHTISFMNCEVKVKKGGIIYNSAIENARHWHGVMESVIRQADQAASATQQKSLSAQGGNISVADELNKLTDLVAKGIITQTEFESQKQKLLSLS